MFGNFLRCTFESRGWAAPPSRAEFSWESSDHRPRCSWEGTSLGFLKIGVFWSGGYSNLNICALLMCSIKVVCSFTNMKIVWEGIIKITLSYVVKRDGEILPRTSLADVCKTSYKPVQPLWTEEGTARSKSPSSSSQSMGTVSEDVRRGVILATTCPPL